MGTPRISAIALLLAIGRGKAVTIPRNELMEGIIQADLQVSQRTCLSAYCKIIGDCSPAKEKAR